MDQDTVVERFGSFLGGVLGGVLEHPVVRVATLAVAGYLVLLWFASAWWTIQDARRRYGDPVPPYLAAGLVVLASPLLFPLALLVYGVVRPAQTLAEGRLHRLENRLAELERERDRCPGCDLAADPAWLSCPTCRTRLAYRCLDCGRAIARDWDLCAWCGAEFDGRRVMPAATSIAALRRPAGSDRVLERGSERSPGATTALGAPRGLELSRRAEVLRAD